MHEPKKNTPNTQCLTQTAAHHVVDVYAVIVVEETEDGVRQEAAAAAAAASVDADAGARSFAGVLLRQGEAVQEVVADNLLAAVVLHAGSRSLGPRRSLCLSRLLDTRLYERESCRRLQSPRDRRRNSSRCLQRLVVKERSSRMSGGLYSVCLWPFGKSMFADASLSKGPTSSFSKSTRLLPISINSEFVLGSLPHVFIGPV